MVPANAAPRANHAPRRWAPEDPVVEERLRIDKFAPVPLFGADEWDLTCMGRSPTRAPYKVRFERLSGRWRLAAKELVAQRINQPVASLRTHRMPRGVGPGACELLFDSMARIFKLLDERGVTSIPGIKADDVEAFRAKIAKELTSLSRRCDMLKTFDRFFESRDHLSEGGLSFRPWPGAEIASIAAIDVEDEAPDENRTDRIPEKVMRPLLFWALAYVDRFSGDILAAEAERRRGPDAAVLAEAERRAELAAPRQLASERAMIARGRTPRAVSIRIEKRLEVYLENLAAVGDGVPAKWYGGKLVPDVDRIALAAGVGPGHVAALKMNGRRQIVASGLPLRLDHLPRATTRLPGARDVWRDRFTLAGLREECRRLQVAAYVVVAYLSGMRDGEVQTLKRGCLHLLRDDRGAIGRIAPDDVCRYKISGLALKTGSRRPRPRKWVVIEPVARAVRVLERLTAHLHASQLESYLFAQLDHDDDTMGLFKGRISDELNDFMAHCRDHVAPRQAGADLPPSGPPWRLQARQFRRTLAWHIANQPFGVVAGMIQYGHASIQMFEGYAGTKDSGFAAEVANERMLANLSDVVEMFEDHGRGVRQAGPMADELADFFRRKREEIGAFPGMVADGRRLRELLAHKAGDLHPGPMVHCFYKPSRARCQEKLPESERVVPAAVLCDPDCPNACWSHKSLDAWKAMEGECEPMLRSNSIGSRKKDIVRRQAALARRVISAIEATGGARA